MDLVIEYTNQPSTTVSTGPQIPNCFISLPTEVAQSLSNLRPFSSLVILRIALSSSIKKQKQFYLAWAGATISKSDTIGIHSQFAEINNLHKGDRVTASVSFRVIDRSFTTVTSATLRPLIYDTQPSDPSEAANAFSQLSAAASALETALLAHVRVLSPNISLPLILPGGVSLNAKVVSISAKNDKETVVNPEFAILEPDAQIVIESPPPPPESLRKFLRVLSLTARIRDNIPDLWRTHAFISTKDAESIQKGFAIVSRKCSERIGNQKERNLGLPVVFQSHYAIPKGHILLPPCIWNDLGLTALSSIFFEQVLSFPRGSPSVKLLQVSSHSQSRYPTFNELKKAEGVYYDNMMLAGYRVNIGGNEKTARTKPQQNFNEMFPWDSLTLKAEEGDDVNIGDDFFWDMNRLAQDEQLQESIKNRTTLQGFRTFSEQDTEFILVNESGSTIQQLSALDDIYNPLADIRLCDSVKSSILPSNQNRLHSVLITAKQYFAQRRIPRHGWRTESIILEGPSGSGKTYFCTVVAAMLRTFAHVRTVWVRCDTHGSENYRATTKRLRRAFRAAIDDGPGLIVLDNIDALAATLTSSLVGEHEVSNSGVDKIHSMLAEEIAERLVEGYENQLMVVMTCKKASELQEVLRVPGITQSIVSMDPPSREERAEIHLKDLENLIERHSDDKYNKRDLLRKASELSRDTEGHCARDFVHCMQATLSNARVKMKSDEKLPSALLVELYTRTVRERVPVSRIGIKTTKPNEKNQFTWSRIGGLHNVKKALKDALELPSRYPKIFAKVPIRLPHGILLYGPPGCGKTLIAQTAAVEYGMRCIMVKGPELMSKYIGESEAETRQAFERATQSKPCILLFDEFDALAPRRGGNSTGVSDRVVNTLLTCMDGAERLSQGVYVIATTSRPEVIDPALLRPGRLDRWIAVDIPQTAEERLEILESLSAQYFNLNKAIRESLQQISEATHGYTGADLGGIINDASLQQQKDNPGLAYESEDDSTVKALHHSMQNSRPSMSQRQRDHFRIVMNRFAPDSNSPTVSNSNKNNDDPVFSEFGRRVALK